MQTSTNFFIQNNAVIQTHEGRVKNESEIFETVWTSQFLLPLPLIRCGQGNLTTELPRPIRVYSLHYLVVLKSVWQFWS